nr:hypothetical protein [uncultured Cohaesibacter sp.]
MVKKVATLSPRNDIWRDFEANWDEIAGFQPADWGNCLPGGQKQVNPD